MDNNSSKKSNKNFVPRITQLDSNEFDKEIHNLLFKQLLEVRKFLPPGASNFIKSEINLLLNLLIFKYSVFKKNSTFGQQLLNLKYKNVLSRKQVLLYVLLKYLMPYLKSKYEDNSNSIQCSVVQKIADKIDVFIKIINFINLVIFLRKGKYPTIIDRLLNLEYSSAKLNRQVGYNYMTREMLWHGFMEFLMHILPILSFRAVKRKLKNVFLSKSSTVKTKKIINFNVHTKCVFCNDFPILPCQISVYCPHLACYYCIQSNMMADEKFSCPACSEMNTTQIKLKFLTG